MLFLNAKNMQHCVDIEQAIQVMHHVFSCDYDLPLRTSFIRDGVTHVMPARMANIQKFGIKVASHFPNNLKLGLPSIQGLMILFDDNTGLPLAIMDARFLTGIRTAAVSALATQVLAPKNAATLAILGSGVQAHFHLEAMMKIRPIEQIHLWSRNQTHANEFIEKYPNLPLVLHKSPAAAVKDADIICTTTASQEVIVKQAYLQKTRVHINAIGAHHPLMQEIDPLIFSSSLVVVEQKEAAFKEAGDLIAANISPDAVKELGEITADYIPSGHTLFKSVGLAIEDLGMANWIYEQALAKNLGVQLIE